MGRITNRVAMKQKHRQLQIDAVLNADPKTITQLPSMASRSFRRESMKTAMQRSAAKRKSYGLDGSWRQVMAQRIARQPTLEQVEKELFAREVNDRVRRLATKRSETLAALRQA